MADFTSRRSQDAGSTPRVYERPHAAVTGYSRQGKRTVVSQEYATHTGEAVGRPGARGRRRGKATRERQSETARYHAAKSHRQKVAATGAAVAEKAGGAWGFVVAHRLPFVILAAVLVVIAMLYGPARIYYQAWRSGLNLQSQYDALVQSNEEVQQQNDRLLTLDGIEDEARKRGYVSEGETGINVQGLTEEDSTSDTTTTSNPWYVDVLDTIFFYKE